jgi:hypothetical protein
VADAVLQEHVLAANGDFNAALMRAMGTSSTAPSEGHSIHSYFPTESSTPTLASSPALFDASLQLEALKAKFGKAKLENAKSAIGDDYDDLQILLAFEKHGGDAKKAMAELMGQSSRTLDRSSLSISRDALRQSANAIRLSRSGIVRSSGIEELPLNLNMSLFNDTEEEEADESNQTRVSLPPLMQPGEQSIELSDTDEDSAISSETRSSGAESSSSDAPHSTTSLSTSSHVEAHSANFDILGDLLKDAFEELKEQRQGELNLKAWPTAAIVPIAPEDMPKPSAPVVRIVDKSELSSTSHDAAALADFLQNRGVPSRERAAASVAARKISSDDYVVIAHTLHTLKQFLKARKDAMKNLEKSKSAVSSKFADANAALALKAQKRSELAQLKAREEAEIRSKTETEVSDERPAPVSLLDLSSFITSHTAAGNDVAISAEMCAELQDNEILELESILTSEKLQRSDSTPKVLAISLSEPEFKIKRVLKDQKLMKEGEQHAVEVVASVGFKNPLCLQLIVVLPALYPECAPILSVRSMSRSLPLESTDLARLEAHLTKVAVEENLGMPCLFTIVQAAEDWLNSDDGIKACALREQAITNINSVDLHSSLKLLFSFRSEVAFHRFEDILNQRGKYVQRAIKFIINAPKASGLEPPLQTSAKTEFPVLNLTGDVDILASLRLIGLSPAAVRVLLQSYDWKLKALSAEYLAS